jgi:hypothetical protein
MTEFSVPAIRALSHLPLLDAIIDETLRMHSVIPASCRARRHRPPHRPPLTARKQLASAAAAAAYNGVLVVGNFVPTGTRVSVLPFTLQRTADLFLVPETSPLKRWFVNDDGSNEDSDDGLEGTVADGTAVTVVASAEATIH